jgi:hypothetical protein
MPSAAAAIAATAAAASAAAAATAGKLVLRSWQLLGAWPCRACGTLGQMGEPSAASKHRHTPHTIWVGKSAGLSDSHGHAFEVDIALHALQPGPAGASSLVCFLEHPQVTRHTQQGTSSREPPLALCVCNGNNALLPRCERNPINRLHITPSPSPAGRPQQPHCLQPA